ncbi:MAG: xanthine dehydrogenase family protein subunit M [Desulfobacterota bacterium]|nr:xanthine dehydrogenase family protein subunit M [Thermodesulfobacteriota bacterium]
MKKFDYHLPKTLDEALNLFASLKNCKYVAGGTDVFVDIKRKKIAPDNLISLRNIEALKIIEKNGGIRIGSCVTHEEILKNEDIKRHYTALHDAVKRLGSKQIRNVATIGGNICNAAPSADTACPLLVFDCVVGIYGKKGERKLSLDEFFLGPGMVSKEEDEIVTFFELCYLPKYSGSAYIKLTRREAMDLAIVSVASRLTFDLEEDILKVKETIANSDLKDMEEKIANLGIKVKQARIAMGVAAPTPLRAKEAETYLLGKVLDRDKIYEASEIASSVARPRDTIRGEAEYRREMIKVLTRRTLLLSVKRGLGLE